MRWLEHFGESDVVRLNRSAPIDRLELTPDSIELTLGRKTISSSEIKSIWFRRGDAWFDGLFGAVNLRDRPTLSRTIADIYTEENRRIREYFHYFVTRKIRSLGHPGMYELNKPIILSLARESGLSIPDFSIVNSREALSRFVDKGAAITKAVSNGVYVWDFERERKAYFTYTERIQSELVHELPDRFPASMVQTEIEKEYEVRTFFLDGETFSMAILSQADETTAVDFRKYNWENPNRMVPIALPTDVADSLRRLFEQLKLNTGSVDFIVDRNGAYTFLEINPIGQYEFLSRHCNYQLDQKIAQWLAR